MKGNMEERARNLAEYIIEHETTVRKAAERFGVSKSTVHTVISISNVFVFSLFLENREI